MSDDRFANLKLTVHDLVAVLRWANVSANRGTKKVELQERWSTALFNGGPPSLENVKEFKGFPDTVPTAWSEWLATHRAWQSPTSEAFIQTSSTIASLLNADPVVSSSTEQFFVFETRVVRRRSHLALGTAEKLCCAHE